MSMYRSPLESKKVWVGLIFLTLGPKALISEKRTSYLSAWRAKWFWHMLWIRVMVIYRWLFLNSSRDSTLIYLRNSCLLTELFDPGNWSVMFLCLASIEERCLLTFGLICIASHPPYCIPWFPLVYACISRVILYFLRIFFQWQYDPR